MSSQVHRRRVQLKLSLNENGFWRRVGEQASRSRKDHRQYPENSLNVNSEHGYFQSRLNNHSPQERVSGSCTLIDVRFVNPRWESLTA